ncbi:hypothetical protein VMCG_08191 [Cytospora schulzeri]|uniref:Uncharacterized protein n=1 Tax=Cytospora schulzeri TaxID=448051 RepID=A0A423VU53_9PEZI|nr:hypothetical protein VMCG_08191 [Valsa malicola]
MFTEELRVSDISLFLDFAKDRKLLKMIWESTDDKKSFTILALDVETSRRGELNYITEMGLSSQPKRANDKRVTRHILVDANQDMKPKSCFRPPGKPSGNHNPPHHEVVLAGFAVHNDLGVLFRTVRWLPPPGMLVIDAQYVWASFLLPPTPASTLPSLKNAIRDFEIPLDRQTSLHNPANDAWYTMELIVRRAEQAVGPVTIKVPPSRARVPPSRLPSTAPADVPTPEPPLVPAPPLVPVPPPVPASPPVPAPPLATFVLPWMPATGKPTTQVGNTRKKGSGSSSTSSSTVTNNPNLIPLDSTRNGLPRKRKMDDRDEDDDTVTHEVAPGDGSDGGRGACQGPPRKRLFSSDTLLMLRDKQRRLWEERSGRLKDEGK